jgi:CP family cyanate transporter-like MFS transporter
VSRRSPAPWLLLAGIVLLAANLRPAAVSIGPVLPDIVAGLPMSPLAASLLTSLPVLAFAVFGAAAPWLARRVGVHRVTLAGLLAVAAGLGGRATTGDQTAFLALSLLALAGMATANVLLPSLVKLHFPDRIGRATALYTTALAVGLTASLLLTVPIAEAFGGWRAGLASWALLAVLAALPWLGLVGHDRRMEAGQGGIPLAAVARTRLGWAMALFFGLQSLQAYSIFGWFAQLWRDQGYAPAEAGALVGLVAAVSIPLSLWLPAAAARRDDQRGLLVAVMICYPLAYLGLMVGPRSLAALWALLAGIGACTFPLILTLIGLRARTPDGTAALSAFTQSVGYLLSAIGPFTVGALWNASGGWTLPLALLLLLTVPQLLLGLYAAGRRSLEDQLPPGHRPD